jgi:gamma-butyrobetaine dioxygenase
MLTQADIIEDGRAVALAWADGRQARFHAVWLRDNALDPATRAPGNGQRLISVLDVPAGTRIASLRLERDGIEVTFAPRHVATFPSGWLAARIYDRDAPSIPGWTGPDIVRWDAASLPVVPGADLATLRADRAALRDWLAAMRRFGVARVRGLGCEPGHVADIAALFGFVRETNYGRVFDVRAVPDPNNLADTNLGLQAHTDNPYRDPVPTVQVLACLENSVEGGGSIVVDGFRAAELLDRDSFALLAGFPARFEYTGSRGVRLRAKRPVLELGPDGELVAVRWNNRSAAAPVDVPYARMEGYYEALRRFAALIESAALSVRFRVEPGEAFVVDNMRVLHARTAFVSGGRRWLQGCYADRDGLFSTLATLEEQSA